MLDAELTVVNETDGVPAFMGFIVQKLRSIYNKVLSALRDKLVWKYKRLKSQLAVSGEKNRKSFMKNRASDLGLDVQVEFEQVGEKEGSALEAESTA